MNLYIDPGTGSMLFTVLIGLLGAGVYGLHSLILRLKFLLTGGKKGDISEEVIPFVIYSDDKRYWNVFEPVCREFERRGIDVVYMTASEDDPAFQESFEHITCRFIGEGNKGFAKLNVLNADVLFATTPGLDVYQWRRSKNVKYYVHILHAVSDATRYRLYGLDYFDAVLLSGEYQVQQLQQLEELRQTQKKDLQVVGQPYMDAMLQRLQSCEPLPEHPVTVLLAPSWGPSSILNRYGKAFIRTLLDTGYRIIIRPHPQSFASEKPLLEDLMAEFPDNEQLQWNRDNDNFEVLRRSDLLISDFSGVMFDFALVFQKPIIYTDTKFDKILYDAYDLDEELWTFEALPRIGRKLTPENFKNIKEEIDICLQDERYRCGIAQAREETWAHIGDSARLTVDYLVAKREALKAEEEVNVETV